MLHGRQTPSDVDDPNWSRPFGGSDAPTGQRFSNVPTWLISTLTVLVLVGMGVGGYIAHPKAEASPEVASRPIYPGTAAPSAGPQTPPPVATPAPKPSTSASATPTPSPSKPSFKAPPESFGTFKLTRPLEPRAGQLWRALYTDDTGGQVWVGVEVGPELRERVARFSDVAEYEGGFACGLSTSRMCVGRLTNGVVTVAAYESTNDALAVVMATLLDSVK